MPSMQVASGMEYANDKKGNKILPKNKMNPEDAYALETSQKKKERNVKRCVRDTKKEKGHDKVKHRVCKEQNRRSMVILLITFTDCMDNIKGKGKKKKE